MPENSNEEEVIVIEDDKSEIEENKDNAEIVKEEKKKEKKLFIIVAILLVVVLISLIILLFIILDKKNERETIPKNEIKKITQKLTKKDIPKKDIESLIKKANILYMNGRKMEALQLLNKLSIYSESLSNYNLGVIKIKEKNYKEALNYFNKAIANGDNRCISALNGAYCSLKLKDKKRFLYYAKLAELYLPDEIKSKSYPFYYALTHYYLGREFEALAGLEKTKTYKKEAKELKTAIYNLYDDPYNVIDSTKDPFILGISYARIGEWSLAKKELQKVLLAYPLKAGVALSLVELKLKEYKNASKHLEKAKKMDKIVYPIKVIIKKDTFDIKEAQNSFYKQFLNKEEIYNLLFYFAPYKVFNLNETIRYLKKGSLGLGADNLEEADTYLAKSSTISNLNIKMSKGIKFALTHHILKANKIFQKLVNSHKYYSILHYNLALTYANLKNYRKAYFHFLRAFNLDNRNYLSGIFAIISGNLAGYKTDALKRNFKDNLDFNNPKTLFYSTLLSFIEDNYSDILSFVQSDFKKTKLNVMLALGIAKVLNIDNEILKEATFLQNLAPKDIVANCIYFYAVHSKESIKKFAFNFQSFFLNGLKVWNMDNFFYGSLINRDIVFKFAKISGQLPKIKLILEEKLLSNDDIIPLLQNLAFVNLYTKHFEESYTIFNDLIDNKNIKDYRTLFYGAVASILAGHHSNAIALLSLSKRANKKAFEARYGLGLLYHEAKNLRGAIIQYSKIPDNFESHFFDFEVVP